MIYLILLCPLILETVIAEDECFRPAELRTKEELCWTEEVEVVDRFVQRSKSVLNFAKKKLGIAAEDENTIQKCEYYLCILRQLRLLNANDYPSQDSIEDWTKKNVIYNQALQLFDQLNKCNDALSNSTILEVHFHADDVNNSEVSQATSKTSENEQSICEIALEFIKCLSKQYGCPVFQFP